MLKLDHLDIKVHWSFPKLDVASVLLKNLNIPQDLRSLITDEEIYKLANVNTKIILSFVKQIIQKTVDEATA